MVYYDEMGNKREFSSKKKIYKGVYLLDDYETCLKTGLNEKKIDIDTLKIIRGLNLEGMYRLKDFLFDDRGKFMAYTMNYYEESPVDFLTWPVEYTISNYLKFWHIVDEMIRKGIFIVDLHDGNVIVNDEGMTIIDVDMYVASRYILPSKIKEHDYRALANIFISLYYISLCDYHGKRYRDICGKVEELFSDRKCVSKKLSRYKYPIDYFLK